MTSAKPLVTAVIFDLDGLLVDSEPVWFKIRSAMFGRFGLVWTEDDQKALMGRSTAAWIDYVGSRLEGKLSREEATRQTLEGMAQSYREHKVRFMPGAQKALEYCSERVHVGLASGSPLILIEAALEANNWRAFFEVVLSSDNVPRGKPAPDVYREAMKQLKVSPEQSVVVEDSGSGILAGKAAGACVVAVPNRELMPPKEHLQKADVVLQSLEEFGQAFEKSYTV